MVIAAAACLVLGWWQWGRFESSSGTARNLGYAMQWPLFALAFLWAYRRFVQLEDEAELQEELAAEEAGAAGSGEPAASAPVAEALPGHRPTAPSAAVTALPEGFLPARPTAPSDTGTAPDDPAHDEYNRLLADLAASDRTPSEEKQ